MTTTEAPPEPMMPTDAELDGMAKGQLLDVIRSHGLPAVEKATAKELRPWARAVVHGRRNAVEAEATGVGTPPADGESPPADVGLAPEPEPVVATTDVVEAPEIELVPLARDRGLTVSKFELIQMKAAYMFKSNLRPAYLKNVEDVGVILLTAHELGIPDGLAMQRIIVQNGRLSMMGELMSALILRDGHRLRADPANDRFTARVWGKRREAPDEEDWVYAEFTIDDAIEAGLCSLADDGTIRARSKEGNKLPWELYTADMLYWRALARLARRNFGDSLGGVSYLPEELGWIEGQAADELEPRKYGRAGEPEPTMTLRQQQSEIAGRIADLDDDLKAELRADWKQRGFPKVENLRPAQIGTVHVMLAAVESMQADRESTDHIDEAVEVPDGESSEGADAQPADGDADADRSDEADTPDVAPPAPSDQSEAEGILLLGVTDESPMLLICIGCHEPIPAHEPPVWGDDDQAYHQACSPFGGA
jgi:hypothetical protein